MSIIIHNYVAGRRVRTIDLARQRATDAMAAVMLDRVTVRDDMEEDPNGHWVTINGAHVFVNGKGEITKGPKELVGKSKSDFKPKPDKAQAATAKAAVHELLSSGHAFSFEELMKATGAKNPVSLSTAISDLKNPKYAGKLGHLVILKNKAGHYYVGKAEDKPAAPTKAASPATAPMPDLTTPASPVSASASLVVKAPATKMSKQQADQEYEKSTLDNIAAVQKIGAVLPAGNIDSVPDDVVKSLALAYKTNKAKHMAQWAANFKGVDQVPAKVEVFPEDIQLIKDLAKSTGTEYAAAISKWKKATADAKAKALTTAATHAHNMAHHAKVKPEHKAGPVTSAPATSLPPVPSHGYSMPHPPEHIAPPGYKGVTVEDFDGASGHHFGNKMNLLKNQLKQHTAGADSIGNKIKVQHSLEARLEASPHFQHLQTQRPSSLVKSLISTWAGSSGDHTATSCAAQLAVRDVFKMAGDNLEMKALSYVKDEGEEKTWESAAHSLGLEYSSDVEKAVFKAGMRDFVLAQYHHTQDEFKKMGITHVHVARGMKVGGAVNPRKVKLALQPASSFSASLDTARSFAGGHRIYLAKVPVSQVLGSYVTGFGCTNEHEVVVLSHDSMTAVEVPSKHYSLKTAVGLAAHIKGATKWD